MILFLQLSGRKTEASILEAWGKKSVLEETKKKKAENI